MKYYILTLLLFIGAVCKAQNIDSTIIGAKDIGTITVNLDTLPLFTLLTQPPFIPDTVKCYMLISNVGLHEYESLRQSGFSGTYSYFDYSTTWRIGYAVSTEIFKIKWKYLDENKTPLPENIIVWMSKTLFINSSNRPSK